MLYHNILALFVIFLKSVYFKVIIARQNSPDAKNMTRDVLGYMLNARDSNGLGLRDDVIRDEVRII